MVTLSLDFLETQLLIKLTLMILVLPTVPTIKRRLAIWAEKLTPCENGMDLPGKLGFNTSRRLFFNESK